MVNGIEALHTPGLGGVTLHERSSRTLFEAAPRRGSHRMRFSGSAAHDASATSFPEDYRPCLSAARPRRSAS